uniref:Nuclear protein, ataxia-telangiectasia locus n=1 Tax=Neogobius melanostomus TaxID=47308 RepID=A0A8C6SLF9_9GOBI
MFSFCPSVRSRVGLANVARQRALASSPSGVVCATVSETISIVSPAQTSHCVLTHSTPVSFSVPRTLTPSSAPYPQSQDGGRLLNTPRESPVQVTEHRLNPAPMSPGRRKWKRSGASGGASSSSRPVAAEEEPEEIADENFPQLVIQNARDKILGDRSLQEKLAENINKILASEPTPQSSRACTNILEPDQSIDEILGLQEEIHMSDDAIHDILEHTESDPAFQALFDLFEYNKTRTADGEPADGDAGRIPEESELPGPAPSPLVKPCQNVESGIVQKEASEPASVKTNITERKTRKSAQVLKKTIITSNRSSRLDNCSATLMVAQEPCRGTSKSNERSPHADAVPMDIDEPQATAAPANISTANVCPTSVASSSIASSLETLSSMVSETTALNGQHENKGAQGCPVQGVSSTAKDPLSALQTVPSSSPSGQVSNCGQGTHLGSSYLASSEMSKTYSTVGKVTNSMSPSSNCVAPATSASPASSATAPSSSVLSSTPPTEPSASNKTGDDSNNIMSLSIIISDNQEGESGADTALNQAISSISGDKVPTIYLSSPAKPPAVPGTPRTNLDEAAQAVSCLQRSETVMASPLTGTSQPQQSYFIQLPFDGAAATAASYILLPPTTDAQNRQAIVPAPVTKGQAIAPNQFGVSPQRQGFTAGSTLILPSPMKPMVLPLSVMGPNTLGNVQMVSNQLVALPNAPVVQQPETVKPPPAGAVKPSTTSGPETNVSNKTLPSSSAQGLGAQNALASPISGHRRILRFDSSGESQTSKVNTSPSAPTSQPSPRTKPAILIANKPKRRIQTIRCSDTVKSTASPPKQKEAVKKGSRKQEHNVSSKEPSTSSSIMDISKPAKPRKRSKSTDGKQNHDTDEDGSSRAKDSPLSRSLSSDSSQKSVSRKEKEATEKGKSREGRAEKRTQETTSVTANKENELKGQEQQQATSSAAPAHATAQPSKAPSKTSALAKQAAEMLHDIQALNSPSTPRDVSSQEESGSDCPRTPARVRKGRDAEGTPRLLVLPGSSDIPTCSPASEAGSESSISMAAHTLMILSRATLARTGTPLKNSLRQEGAGERSPTTAKNAKKRKQSTPTSSPPAKKESKRTPSKKKERKKLTDCFPQDLDVDKFLSSLHYDE